MIRWFVCFTTMFAPFLKPCLALLDLHLTSVKTGKTWASTVLVRTMIRLYDEHMSHMSSSAFLNAKYSERNISSMSTHMSYAHIHSADHPVALQDQQQSGLTFDHVYALIKKSSKVNTQKINGNNRKKGSLVILFCLRIPIPKVPSSTIS